jgi:hypothetical protein
MIRPVGEASAIFFVEIFFADLNPVDSGGSVPVDSLQDWRKGIGGGNGVGRHAPAVGDVAKNGAVKENTAERVPARSSRGTIEAGHGRR